MSLRCLECVLKVFGKFLKVSGRFLEGVWAVS